MRWLLFVLLCFSSQVWGQVEFAPVGAKWGMSYWSFATPNISYREMIVEKDTLFEGKLAKKILVGQNDGVDFMTQYNAYVHQSEDSIFVYNGSQYIYLYNFSLEVGDSINIPGFFPLTYYIDSIAIEMVNDIPLKKQFASVTCPGATPFTQEIVIMEKIGPLVHFDILLLEHLCLLDGMTYAFRCYSDPNFPEYIAPHLVNNDCFIPTSLENPLSKKSQFKVFPNPVQEQLQLTFSEKLHHQELDIEIFSTQGISVLTSRKNKGQTTLNLNIHTLPTGMYFINIQNQHTFIQSLKVIKQ